MADDDKVNGVDTAPQMPGKIIVDLRKEVLVDGNPAKKLEFREPTGGDIERAGNPVNLDMFSGDVPRITFDTKAMTAMMSILANVPPSTIRSMHPKDWNTVAWQLVSFFTPDL